MALGLLVDLDLLFLLFLLFVPRALAQCGAHRATVVGAVGGSVCLSPSPEHGHGSYSRIHWRLNESRKLASWDPQQKVQYPPSARRDRLELLGNFSLRISRLQKGDSGEYQLYLEDATGREDKDRVTLRVYDVVPKPTVTVTVTQDDDQQCNATLECSVGLQEVTYEWVPPRQVLLEAGGGPVQKVSFNPSEGTYVCRVSNPASSNSASLTYRHPCSWTVESSTDASSCTATGGLLVLGHLLLLFLHLALA
ncbi:CD48 antigen [Chiroxiphia lanceolata]|uniref:CD48 antigen n=1 Tax=Chiroxiphia lanceolata TaxID=296741 RepID=UPI0013CED4C3|nr:CD48 antigen [Chiroxiphia lanceolata]